MSRCINPGRYLQPIKSDNTEAARVDEKGYYTLGVGTYYVDLGGSSATHLSIHPQWTSALVGVLTFWSSDMGPLEAALTSTDAGDWIQEDPSTAYIPITGTGASVSNMTITLAGGGAGGARVNISALAAGRMRLRAVISTAGALRVAHFGKE